MRKIILKINDKRGELNASIIEMENHYQQGMEVSVSRLIALRLNVEKSNDQLFTALIKMVIAVHYSKKNNIKQSIKELEEALVLLKYRKDDKLIYFINRRLADNFIERLNFKKANYHLDNSLPPFPTKTY